MAEEFSIGEIADMAGIPASTIRYYERIGILPAPRRSSGQRRYARDVLPVLAIIQLAKDANFSLPEIHDLLYGEESGPTPSLRWRELASRKLREVDEVIARAQAMKHLLEEGLRCASLQYELDACALLTSVADPRPEC
jgi:MerR family redox-sensitive transcriptional activator SoxR